MTAEERRSRILDRARSKRVVRVAELVDDFGVSTMTIRRDLAVLAQRGVIEKIHGGGVLRPGADDGGGQAQETRTGSSAVAPPVALRADAVPSNCHVGIVVPSADYYYPPIVAGARQVLETMAIRRALAISRYQQEQDELLVRRLLKTGSTALLLAPNVALDEDDLERIGWLLELPVPVVLVERTIRQPDRRSPLSSVRTDHERGCERAIHHLATLGHQGVALLTHGGSQSGTRVIAGWERAVARSSMDDVLSPRIVSPEANQWLADDAINGILDQLRDVRATAIIVQGDRLALALAHHAQGRGWRIPKDLSVIAYDDEIAEMADPPLTAVSPPKEWLGQAATELLLAILTSDRPQPSRQIVIEPELVVRGSTAAPRSGPLR